MGIIHICFSHSLTPRKAFFLCFPCFLCDSIKPRRGFQISSIRSIVPQELVFIKTYPFGMIKQIQRIYGIYGLFCLKIYLFDFGKICTIWLRRAKGSARRALPPLRRARRSFCVFGAFCVKNEASHALRWNEKMKE